MMLCKRSKGNLDPSRWLASGVLLLPLPMIEPSSRGSRGAFMVKVPKDRTNIAELGFDTNDGLSEPASYIPMNDDVRARCRYGTWC